ncbi:MAG: RNA polymerase sigma factor [Steroidobacteraceae bacterium]
MSNTNLLEGWRERWNRSLLQFLGRRVRAKVDVEDLAQETYLRLLRARDLHEIRNPQAYVLTVAAHVIAEWRHGQPLGERAALDDDALVDGSTPEFELAAHVCQERLNETLAALAPRMRAVLLLRLRDERTYKEIARDLALTERQVKRYLERGYEQLRATLVD